MKPHFFLFRDIYDISSGNWSTTQLSQARGGIAGAGAGNKILFAGGLVNNIVSKIVDIYDVSSNSWTTAELSEARNFIVAAATGNKVLFAGGAVLDSSFDSSLGIMTNFYRFPKTVDIFTAR
jgi:N-acetylneuraminic acid mutarotase